SGWREDPYAGESLRIQISKFLDQHNPFKKTKALRIATSHTFMIHQGIFSEKTPSLLLKLPLKLSFYHIVQNIKEDGFASVMLSIRYFDGSIVQVWKNITSEHH